MLYRYYVDDDDDDDDGGDDDDDARDDDDGDDGYWYRDISNSLTKAFIFHLLISSIT